MGFFAFNAARRFTTVAAQIDASIKIISAAYGVNSELDHTIVCDSDGATGNISLPAGINGLEFVFSSKGNGAALYTLVANGGELFDVSVATVISVGVVSRITFLSGTWYAG